MVSEEVEIIQEPQTDESQSVIKRFVVNVASLFSVQLANMLLPLLTVPYVVRIIGPERLGMLNFSLAFIAYFSLVINYGFDMAAVRSIAANRSNTAAVNRVFCEVLAGKILLWALSTVLFAGIVIAIPEFRAQWVLHTCSYLTCIGVVLFPLWLYQGMEDLSRVALFNLIVKVLFSLSVFVLIRQPGDYIYQNLSMSVAQVLVSVVALVVAIRRYKLTISWPLWTNLKKRFIDDRTLFFSSLTITLYAGSNVFLLGLLSNAYNVGIFSAGTRLESISRAFAGIALNQAFFPIVANAFGKSREQGLRLVRTTFFPLAAFMGVISLGLWIIAPFFITLFYGEAFRDAITILRIVSLLPLAIGISNLLGLHTMLNLRMDKAFFAITAMGSVIGLSLNLLLIKTAGHVGAAWAWVITEGCITIAMYIYLRSQKVEVVQLSAFSEAVAFTKARLRTVSKLIPSRH